MLDQDHVLTITGSGEMTDYDDGEAHFEGAEVYSVVVGEGVTSIGSHAFDGYFDVKKVLLPKSLKRIGESAFFDCGLESITIPDAVATIGNRCFSNCGSLRDVKLPASLTTITSYTFDNCNSASISRCHYGTYQGQHAKQNSFCSVQRC